MSIFKTKRTNKDLMKEMIKECDDMVNDMFKTTDMNLTDLDEQSGRMIGKLMESWKRICDLSVEQSEILDRLEDKVEVIEEMNKKMLAKIDLIKV